MDSDPSSKGDERAERESHEDDDPRRDAMAPPEVPCECWCLHCGRTFMSDQMWFQRVVGDKNGFAGFWMCPTPNCGGAGFTFDIFPTDPDHAANEGWHDDEEEVEGEYDPDDEDLGEAETPWDPSEAKYRDWDDDGEEDDDLEGEEWKHGLEPGERPETEWSAEGRREWEEEQRRYDQPDERPREVDWSDRETLNDDDIPF
jgi:hypothetical protein